MHAAANPYEGNNFFSFFATVVERLVRFIQGGPAYFALVSEEGQILAL